MRGSKRGRLAGPLLLVFAAACSDNAVLNPELPSPEASLAQVTCTATVAAGTLSCGPMPAATSLGARADRVVGDQERYTRLASAATSYDAGSEVFQSTLTVENLLRASIGTTDGTTVAGVKVFFARPPTATSGAGTITISNADSTGSFTGSAQEYFLYPEILRPYQISQPRVWQFSVPNTVNTFTFQLYVAAPQTDETAPLLDRVWTGMVGAAWEVAANWQGGVPDSTSTVAVPPDSLIASRNRPALAADADVSYLRVGPAASLQLNGHTIRVRGNTDATGAIAGGTLWMSGDSALMRGTVPALRLTSGTTLQGAVLGTGALSVQNGSITTRGLPLSIQIP